MEVKHLVDFYKLCSYKSLSAAAKNLGKTPQAVSKMVGTLEKELGTKLISSKKSGFDLTEEGKRLFQSLNPYINSYHEMENIAEAVRSKPYMEFKLVIATNMLTNFPSNMLTDFKRIYPNINIIFREEHETVCESVISNGEADIAVTILPVDEKKYTSVSLFDEPIYLIATPDNILMKKSIIRIKDLDNQPIIAMDDRYRVTRHFFELCAEKKVNPVVMQRVSAFSTMVYLTSSRYGAGFISKRIFDRRKEDSVKSVLIDPAEFCWKIGIITKKDAIIPEGAGIFRDFLIRYCKEKM